MQRLFGVVIACLFLAHPSAQQGLDGIESAEYIMIQAAQKATSDWGALNLEFQYTITLTEETFSKKGVPTGSTKRIYPPGSSLPDEEMLVRTQDLFQNGRHLYKRDYAHSDPATYLIAYQPTTRGQWLKPLPDAHFGKNTDETNEVLNRLTGTVVVRKSDFAILKTNGETDGPIDFKLGLASLKRLKLTLEQATIQDSNGKPIHVPTIGKADYDQRIFWSNSKEIQTITFSNFVRRAP